MFAFDQLQPYSDGWVNYILTVFQVDIPDAAEMLIIARAWGPDMSSPNSNRPDCAGWCKISMLKGSIIFMFFLVIFTFFKCQRLACSLDCLLNIFLLYCPSMHVTLTNLYYMSKCIIDKWSNYPAISMKSALILVAFKGQY